MAIGATYIDLKWDAAQDNVAVAGYELYYENGTLIEDVGNTLYHRVSGLSNSTTYGFKLKAYDTASPRNVSDFGNTINVTTLAQEIDETAPSKMTITLLVAGDDVPPATMTLTNITQ